MNASRWEVYRLIFCLNAELAAFELALELDEGDV